ncbi:type III secretion system cytoplasmic ring protein SctQ [Comamonas sp. NLF-1-9]|uniref:type III secretion system cytoplasmic ring protein SctQ n=1 Tax=Comamonas sp. NLF-1-9 TaxID=2853163 RepID=UPI001C491ECD|nr:type III secretion system cytoplasmic ring protein SctQ [Comamonas sp. NLF-1-9]QXL83630.1 type III secretion system cytoplasmic ring protein SctQ [Comamonas sp. NLF-1-9]
MNDLSSPASPPVLERLSRNEAQARTTIAQRGGALALRLAGQAWQVDLLPLAGSAAPAPQDWMLQIEWAGATLCVCVPQASVGELSAPLLDGASLGELPAELALAVLEAALVDVFSALRTLGRGEPQLLQASAGGAPASGCRHGVQALLRQSDGPAALDASLHLDALGLLLLAGLLARRPPRPPALNALWPLRLPAEIGCTRVTAQELASLSAGDVVLLEVNHVGAQRMLWLSADGRHGLRVQLPAPSAPEPGTQVSAGAEAQPPQAPALIVTHAWSATMPTNESTPVEPLAADAAPASLDALPVRLSFDLGEVTLTLAQAQTLQPGQTIELARPLSGGVRIRANGALVGEGDLVEIDGQLGVSVRTLALQNP